jgi:hypothetical protein
MKTSSAKKAFQQLLLTGLLGWIVGSLALLACAWFVTVHESVFDVVMWAASHWWTAFVLGLLALLARGVVLRESPVTALLAYLLPMGIIVVLGGVCLAIYPDALFREEMMGYLPVLLVFYLFGYLWLRAREGISHAFARAVLPPVLGGLMILGLVAVPTFTGNGFRYRNAFALEVVKVTNPDRFVVTDAVLEIRKPGNYKFTAPQFPLHGMGIGPGLAPETVTREILWGAAGEPKEGAAGKFPLQIRWQAPEVPAGMPPMPGFEDMAVLEVRDANSAEVILSTVAAPFSGTVKK